MRRRENLAAARTGLVRQDKPSKPPDPVVVNPAVRSTVEREIKLAIDDHFRLPPLPGIPLPRRLLTSTYYDSSQYNLAHAAETPFDEGPAGN